MSSSSFDRLLRSGLQISAIGIALLAASPARAAGTLWYNGDYDDDDASTNESDVAINDPPSYFLETSLVYDDFIVPTGQVWTLTSMATNDQMAYVALPTTATWEIRSGMSAGNGGTLLYNGDTTATATLTHAADGNNYIDPEYNISAAVTGVVLTAGTYWMAVAPDDVSGGTGFFGDQSFIETTSGANAIGNPPGNDGLSFINNNLPAGNGGEVFAVADDPDYSASVSGMAVVVPEPAGWPMLAAGLAGALCLVRRRSAARPV
jgi:hypothetical protein